MAERVTAITINYNLSEDTINCVHSLLRSNHKDLDIILVDNGSEYSDFEKVKNEFKLDSQVEVLRIEKNVGYVEGVNSGIRFAISGNADYIMVMNNDAIIDASSVSELLAVCRRHRDKAIVSGKVYDFYAPDVLEQTGVLFTDKRFLFTYYPGKNEKDTGKYEQEALRDSLDDVFWLFPAKLIGDIGFYCNYFFLYAEQGDFAQRARRAGYDLVYTPKAKIWHKGSMTSGNGNKNSPRINYWRGKSMFIFQYRNLKRKYFILLFIKSISKYFVKYLLSNKITRKEKEAFLRGYFRGFLWLFNKVPDRGYNPY